MQLEITVNSAEPDEDLISLSQWLQREPDLAGEVTLVRAKPSEEQLGGAWETLAVALGSGGAFATFARSLEVWFRNRPRVSVKIKRDREIIELDAGQTDITELLRIALGPDTGTAQ